METRYLIAPKLNQNNFGKQVIGYRPCRHGPPRIQIEIKNINNLNKKIIIGHNYGHAGSGWTLAPGIVNYLNKILINSIKQNYGSENFLKEITIIGAGVIGLFTASNLIQLGYSNLILIAENFEELTSHIAGGFVCPFALEIDNSIDQNLFDKFCVETYNFYKDISQGNNIDFDEKCAKIMPAYVDDTVKKSLEPYLIAGVMQQPKQVLVQFDVSPKKQQKMFVFDDAILIQTNIMMKRLEKILIESEKVKFIKKKIERFEDVEAEIIINCSGIGAKNLCSDEKIYPIQGHLINLKEQNEAELNYMIINHGELSISESNQLLERPFYMFPKRTIGGSLTDHSEDNQINHDLNIGIIGGTFVIDADQNTPNNNEFNLIIQRARNFFFN